MDITDKRSIMMLQQNSIKPVQRKFQLRCYERTIVFVAILLALAKAGYGQCNLCVTIKIESKEKEVSLAKLENTIVRYTLTNCSKKNLRIDKNEIPGYEDEFPVIYFKVYKYDDGYKPFYIDARDIQRVVSSDDHQLKPGESYTYNLRLFDLYTIKTPGRYKLVGLYKVNLILNKGCDGYYLQESPPIEINIIK